MLHSISHLINRNTFTYQKYVSFETHKFSSLIATITPIPASLKLNIKVLYIQKLLCFSKAATSLTLLLTYITLRT